MCAPAIGKPGRPRPLRCHESAPSHRSVSRWTSRSPSSAVALSVPTSTWLRAGREPVGNARADLLDGLVVAELDANEGRALAGALHLLAVADAAVLIVGDRQRVEGHGPVLEEGDDAEADEEHACEGEEGEANNTAHSQLNQPVRPVRSPTAGCVRPAPNRVALRVWGQARRACSPRSRRLCAFPLAWDKGLPETSPPLGRSTPSRCQRR